jgi:diguanylate cyclase (GGDEF)-like protein
MSRTKVIWIYVLAVASLAIGAFPALIGDYGPFTRAEWGAALLLFVASPAAESLVVHINFRKSAHSFSLLELPLTVGILTLPPLLVVLAYGLGSGLVLLIRRHQPPVKLMFNCATFVLTATVALFIFRLLPRSESFISPATWMAVTTAVLTGSMLGTGLVVGVISIAEHRFDFRGLWTALLWGISTATGGISLGIAATILANESIVAVVFVTAPLLAIFAANRAYESEHERRRSLEVVFDTSRALNEEGESEPALLGVLSRFHESMSSDFAALYLEQGSKDFLRLLIDSDGQHRSIAPRSIVEPLLELANRRGHAWSLAENASKGPEHSENRTTEELAVVRSVSGRLTTVEALVSPLLDDNETLGIVLVGSSGSSFRHLGKDELSLFETVCRSIAAHARLSRGAFEDALTGLPNRRRLIQRLETAFELGAEARHALLLIDLDDFKGINDTFGHAVGDGVLAEVGHRLRQIVPDGWMAARLGGDEFAILGQADSVAQCARIGELALEALSELVEVGAQKFQIRASIGLALGGDADSPAALLRNADTALYEAKGLGKGQLMVFNQPMYARAARRFRLGEALRDALNSERLYVVVQPVVDLATSEVIGGEALVRWHDAEFGAVPPAEFVQIAEEMALSVPLATKVLSSVVEEFRTMPGSLAISMNVSPGDLGDVEFVRALLDAAFILRPHVLGVEITERMLLSDERIGVTLAGLRGQGIKVYVDDFGTGYSSLAYLKDLSLDYLKIPREFVSGIEQDSRTLAIVQGVVALGRALGLTTVAEGVETREQQRLVLEAGAAYGQGYLFDRPISFAEFRLKVSATSLRAVA